MWIIENCKFVYSGHNRKKTLVNNFITSNKCGLENSKLIDCGRTGKKNNMRNQLSSCVQNILTHVRASLFTTERYKWGLSFGCDSSCTQNGSLFIIFTVINCVLLRWLSMFRFDNASNCSFLHDLLVVGINHFFSHFRHLSLMSNFERWKKEYLQAIIRLNSSTTLCFSFFFFFQ